MKFTLIFWLVNFLPVSIALAIFEIWLEKHKHGSWGKTEFNNPYWEEKANLKIPFLKYLSRYHLIMFLIVMPVLFVGSMFLWSYVLGYSLSPTNSKWYMSVVSFMILFGAIWLGNSGLEDFFYFAIQSLTGWREPNALRKVVINKDFAWFKDWLPPIFGLNIPGHWIFCTVGSLILLVIQHYLIMR